MFLFSLFLSISSSMVLQANQIHKFLRTPHQRNLSKASTFQMLVCFSTHPGLLISSCWAYTWTVWCASSTMPFVFPWSQSDKGSRSCRGEVLALKFMSLSVLLEVLSCSQEESLSQQGSFGLDTIYWFDILEVLAVPTFRIRLKTV